MGISERGLSEMNKTRASILSRKLLRARIRSSAFGLRLKVQITDWEKKKKTCRGRFPVVTIRRVDSGSLLHSKIPHIMGLYIGNPVTNHCSKTGLGSTAVPGLTDTEYYLLRGAR